MRYECDEEFDRNLAGNQLVAEVDFEVWIRSKKVDLITLEVDFVSSSFLQRRKFYQDCYNLHTARI